ncbi:isochorismatase family protein [Microbacterium sp. K27]|uniref:isochorismatase family protein n=1 Tax=Microbacterium sp. K27 TaxID=2305445 RepID=UPI00109BE1CC|nr:isochorismatase family protein [Microbacterium sp. K27]
MGLPRIATYDVPGVDEYPEGRVDWTLDPTRSAILVHDMQQYFVDAFADADGPVGLAIGHIARLLDAARAAGVPVIYTAQPAGQDPVDRGLLSEFWGPGLQDEESAAIVDELRPVAGDTILTKWRYNAFIRTPLRETLAAQDRDQLVIVGVYAHIGCLLTAADAFMNDIRPFLVADAVADFSREDHLFALDYAANRCARVLDTDTALAALAPGATGVGR